MSLWGRSLGNLKISSKFFSEHFWLIMLDIFDIISSISKLTSSTVNLPASILEKSKISLIMPKRCLPAC